MTRSIRSLPRLFLPGASATAPIALPPSEIDKFRKVLRLRPGDEIAILPNDGSLIRCEFRNVVATPIAVEWPETEPSRKVVLVQALPKGDRLETVIRMGTELGVQMFAVFPAARSVAQWEPKKVGEKLRRYEAIAREAAEQSFRSLLPEIVWLESLLAVFSRFPKAIVLSEIEGIGRSLSNVLAQPEYALEVPMVVGPEGGWDPKELALIGDRGVSMGPLVLRTDTAGVVAAALALLP